MSPMSPGAELSFTGRIIFHRSSVVQASANARTCTHERVRTHTCACARERSHGQAPTRARTCACAHAHAHARTRTRARTHEWQAGDSVSFEAELSHPAAPEELAGTAVPGHASRHGLRACARREMCRTDMRVHLSLEIGTRMCSDVCLDMCIVSVGHSVLIAMHAYAHVYAHVYTHAGLVAVASCADFEESVRAPAKPKASRPKAPSYPTASD